MPKHYNVSPLTKESFITVVNIFGAFALMIVALVEFFSESHTLICYNTILTVALMILVYTWIKMNFIDKTNILVFGKY